MLAMPAKVAAHSQKVAFGIAFGLTGLAVSSSSSHRARRIAILDVMLAIFFAIFGF